MGRYDYYSHKTNKKYKRTLLEKKSRPVLWTAIVAVALLMIFVFLCWLRVINIQWMNAFFDGIFGA